MKKNLNIALVFIFDHHNLVVENFGNSIGSALKLFDMDVEIISVSKDLSNQLSNVDLSKVELIISIGPMPLAIQINGIKIYDFFQCPFYLYLIDSPIYDCARFPITIDYIIESLRNSRLKIGFAEKSYMHLFENYIKSDGHTPNLKFLPFAAFPCNRLKNEGKKNKRIMVVGGLGSELTVAGARYSENLIEVIELNNPYGMSKSNANILIDKLECEDFTGNVAKAIIETWNLDPKELLKVGFLKLACSIDGHIKYSRRISVINSAIGVEVDFYWTGWKDKFGDTKKFNFYQDIKHHQIAETSKKYSALLNFDPNWEHGVHDRVFTGISAGTSVITNRNNLFREDGFGSANISQYVLNAPKVKILAEEIFEETPVSNEESQIFLSRNNWHARIASMLISL